MKESSAHQFIRVLSAKLLAACLILAGTSLVLWGTDKMKVNPIRTDSISVPRHQGATASTPRQTPVTESDLIYPGAQLVETDERSDEYWKHTIYRTSSDHGTVLNYYRTEFPKRGWTLISDMNSLIFDRLEGRREASWNVTLEVAFEVFENGDTGIHLSLGRWPDINNIPLYKDATDIQTIRAADATSKTKVVAYFSEANPKQLEQFYKTTLQKEYAWRVFEDHGLNSKLGVVFGYNETLYDPLLLVTGRAQPDGSTKVELKLEQNIP